MQELHLPDGAFSAIVTFPAADVVTVAEMKAHLRIDSDDEDTVIGDCITDAIDEIDAENGQTGRALITQTWSLVMPVFPASGRFDLPVSPVQSITSVTYYDGDNAEQTLTASAYRMTALPDRARVDLVNGYSWPATYDRADAVTVTYVAGYGDASTDIPGGIRRAVKMLAAYFYEHREAATEAKLAEAPLGVRHMLAKFRVPRGHI
mgnify:CR=1 FL=1